jgi:hypothetical protein
MATHISWFDDLDDVCSDLPARIRLACRMHQSEQFR